MQREPLDYDAFLAHRTVSRLRTENGAVIEKVTAGRDLASPYLSDNAEREHAAYTSGLLADLGPIRAPRLIEARRDPDGSVTLLLEEVAHEGGRPLGADALVAAAHDLGGMAARFLDDVPDLPWLFSGWIDRHSQPGAWAEGIEVLARTGSPALRLIGAQGDVREILEGLPITLCHHDAVGANVLRSAGRTVLIDWESVGPGPVGADLASLLEASARRGDASAHVVRRILPDTVEAYAAGLGGRVSTLDVQTGLDAAICLRWKLARDVAVTVETGEPARRGSAPQESPETALDELRTATVILLEAAERLLGPVR
ncbi:aminoglycoside phosphotransferase family protein [Naasia lichenicola]|uniref:Aminoglycoside phosphotransferase family protein n=1 Tax=Naasia lichenicola TaxID=2565933 RepID=A0A4S4FJE4_9MICO|nr:aminoglycoside phosphotransferase family protein [Naasia lichenicola]THG29256.1 aminoglycoside phosphotransferase family protein [Naasia lichenicola]